MSVYLSCTPTANPCLFGQTTHTTARSKVFGPPLSHSTVLIFCPSIFPRHHVPQDIFHSTGSLYFLRPDISQTPYTSSRQKIRMYNLPTMIGRGAWCPVRCRGSAVAIDCPYYCRPWCVVSGEKPGVGSCYGRPILITIVDRGAWRLLSAEKPGVGGSYSRPILL